uniref:ankyrin repeat domain-containing protein 53-like n=1 Tax=Pristiophorus japonicus TaxID=55135 RepID=UPI00398F82A6
MATGKVKKWNREEMLSDELMAATLGDIDWLRLSLSKAKGKVAVDQNGYNAMHLAVQNKRFECLKVLVEDYHMDVNLANPKGWSPIHLILNKEAKFRAHKYLMYLLSIGADPNIQTVEGLTPLHQAAELGLLQCIITLVEAGATVTVKDARGHRPIDLAKIWGHRVCARYLLNVVWQANRTEFTKQMQKLRNLKLVLLKDEKRLHKLRQEEKDYLNKESYALWLERKNLSDIVRTSSSFLKPRSTAVQLLLEQLRESVKSDVASGGRETLRVVPFAEPKRPCRSQAGPGDARARLQGQWGWKERRVPGWHTLTCTVPSACDAKPAWNGSTNPAMPPVTDIARQVKAEPQAGPEVLVQHHDFGLFRELVLDWAGRPALRAKVGEAGLEPLPTLPFDVLSRELFPDSSYHRIRIPEEFTPVHVIDLPKKRRPLGAKSEVELGLREWAEPGEPCLTPPSTCSTRPPAPSVSAGGTPEPSDNQHLSESRTRSQDLSIPAPEALDCGSNPHSGGSNFMNQADARRAVLSKCCAL